MKITRLLRTVLIAILVATGASSCCSVKRYLVSIGPESEFQRSTAAVHVTLILRNVATSDPTEWKIASDQMCTQSTGIIGQDTEAFERTWDVGSPVQHIWFWWATLNGEADATLLVNNVIVFQGHCAHLGYGKVRMIETCSYPRVYKTLGTGPYLQEPLDRNETDIVFAISKLPGRFGIR
ncbi:MAG: hypothetical protein JO313_04440 [Verrucomicrobia bacterium]|nr:hypothetical protein [Verrucomicrobiota bacterium]MBV9645629.1 hypothetical protein [Verrucomicrobiota bacterium]